MFKTHKERKWEARILYPAKQTFKYKGCKWLTTRELEEYCSHEAFLRKPLYYKLQEIKTSKETST